MNAMRTMRWMAVFAGACGGDGPKDTATLDQSCSPYPSPEDALESDVIEAGLDGYVCYLPAPEGICMAAAGADAAFAAFDGGKDSVGCTSGVLVIDGTCPLDLVLGECQLEGLGQVWQVYPCNRWNDLPGGEAVGCEGEGGVWVPAEL